MAQNIRAAKALSDEAAKLALALSGRGLAVTEVAMAANGDCGTLCTFEVSPVPGALNTGISVSLTDEGKKGPERFGVFVAVRGLDGVSRIYEGTFADKKESAAFAKGAVALAAGTPDRTE